MISLPQARVPLAITSGEPAGIGLDVCLGILQHSFDYPVEVLVDLTALAERADELHRSALLERCLADGNSNICFRHIPTANQVIAGKLDVNNVPYVLNLLDTALEGIEEGRYAGIVTAPIHKGIINESGRTFTGHTEYFQQKANVRQVVMMLSNEHLQVALVTTHLPLKEVSVKLSKQLILDVVSILNQELLLKFKIPRPKIAVTGLNPHAGEGGHLGKEELEVIIPALEELKDKGVDVSGPYPADTVFQQEIIDHSDVILAMYHDQGLPVLKYASFGNAVNITLGLPYVRTSVDHGTALSLAGSGRANASSLIRAIEMAQKMIL